MARSTWNYLKNEKRVGEYELFKQVGHWWILDSEEWPEELKNGFHIYSETGVAMVEPTRLHIKDHYRYRDPYKLTYRSYTIEQDNEEKKLDAVIEGAKLRNAFQNDSVQTSITQKYIPAMRHYFWGTGMLETYGSAYTRSGTVMNTLMYQVFDSMRHAQRLVELSWELNQAKGIVVDSRDIWLNWPEVQPLRKFIEYSLTNYDWAENFIMLNFVLDPIFQPLHTIIMVQIPESQGNWAIPQFWLRLAEDIKRHLVCGEEFIKVVLKEDARNKEIIQEWISKWYGMSVDCIDGLKPLIDDANKHGFNKTYKEIKTEILSNYADKLKLYGLEVPIAVGGNHG